MARSAALAPMFVQGGIVLLLGLVALAGCGTPVGTPTGASRGVAAASPTLLRPGPGTPTGTPATPLVGTPPLGTPTAGPATPSAGATPTQARNPALLALLRGAQTLTISEGASVYGPISDTRTSFALERGVDGFAGTGSYAVQSYSGPKSSTTRSVALPEAAFLAFVERLANAPMREGPYDLGPKASDYYPEVQISLASTAGAVVFHSESQKAQYVPWQAMFGGKSYVIDSAEPTIALRGLDSYFQRSETLRSLTAAVEATKVAIPTPTRVTPLMCRAPAAGQPTPTPIAVSSPDPAAARVAPGAQPKVGEVINLAWYFRLPGSTFLSAGGNFAPISVSDRARIDGFVAALDREATVIGYSSGPLPTDTILFTFDVSGKPVNFGYSAERGVVAFGVAGQSYAVASPPAFRELWAGIICSGNGR